MVHTVEISSHYVYPKITCITGFTGHTVITSFVGNSSGKWDHGSFTIVQMTSHRWNS